jgi:hypothetical protein
MENSSMSVIVYVAHFQHARGQQKEHKTDGKRNGAENYKRKMRERKT